MFSSFAGEYTKFNSRVCCRQRVCFCTKHIRREDGQWPVLHACYQQGKPSSILSCFLFPRQCPFTRHLHGARKLYSFGPLQASAQPIPLLRTIQAGTSSAAALSFQSGVNFSSVLVDYASATSLTGTGVTFNGKTR